MHRLLVTTALCAALCGCGFSTSMIKSDTIAFDDVIEDTTNKLLLLNVLRARDKAPLHFADIPSLRETIQQTTSLSWLSFLGPRLPTANKDSLTLGANLMMSPSFEVTHLQSKDFNTGMASPIDPKFVKYWLDRGLDRRIVLLAFFSSVDIIETPSREGPRRRIRVMNSPREAIELLEAMAGLPDPGDLLRCDTLSEFQRYLTLINRLTTFFAHSYRERQLVAQIKLEQVKDIREFTSLDPAKTQFVFDRETGTYKIYALTPEQKVTFCFYEGDSTAESCSRPVLDVEPPLASRETPREVAVLPPPFPTGVPAQPSAYCRIYNAGGAEGALKPHDGYPKHELRLHIRSVGEIFQFLGDLLHYQDELARAQERAPALRGRLNNPVTFGYCPAANVPGCGDVFIRLDDDPCNARFGLVYRDRTYTVANYTRSAACAPRPPARATPEGGRAYAIESKDHTLEMLGVLHQLVGLNKSASDIRATPFVQIVP